MSLDFQPSTPAPGSRSLRLAEFRRSVERAAPVIDQTQVLTDEQLAELDRVRAERKAAVEHASKHGRAALVQKLCEAADRLVGNTPTDGTPLRT